MVITSSQRVLDAFLIVANIAEAERQGITVPTEMKNRAIDRYLAALSHYTAWQKHVTEEQLG